MPSPDMPFQVWTVITSIVAIITLVRFVPSMNHHVSPYVIWSFLDSWAKWTSPLISSKSDGKFLKELQTKMLTIWAVWRKLTLEIVSIIYFRYYVIWKCVVIWSCKSKKGGSNFDLRHSLVKAYLFNFLYKVMKFHNRL